MAMSGGSGGTIDVNVKYKNEKLEKSIVIEDIKIVERIVEIPVPILKNIETEQIKYITKEEAQTKYITKEEPSLKYVPYESPTMKYKVIEEATIKYVPREVECEKPVPVDKKYERPVIVDKEYEVFTVKDLEATQKVITVVPQLIQMIVDLEKTVTNLNEKIKSLCEYKLVEQEVKVPQITYVPTPVERIVWKDVVRERVKNAD